MSQKFTLGIDIGTSSVRGALYDGRGDILPKTFVKREWVFKATSDGGSETDPETTFKNVVRTIDQVLAASSKLNGEIQSVAPCALWHSLVGVDDRGKPTTKVLGWADTRSRDYTAVLRKRFDASAVHNRTGATFHSSFWPAKLLWLRNDFPDIFARTARWLSLSDFIAMRLSDAWTTSVSMASGTGVFDIRKCDWDDELLKFLKIRRSQLPLLAGDNETCQLNPRFAKRWPRLRNANWFPSIADGAANNIGSGCTTKDRAALMIGTSGAMRVAYEGEPPLKIPPGLWCYRIDRHRVIVGGALSDGGGLYAWLKDRLRVEATDAEIADTIALRGPRRHGLTLMPFFFGERSTGYHEGATGSISGLTSSHDTIDILHAAMEAVAFRFAEVFDQLNEVTSVGEIVASGGAIDASPIWAQIIADVLGRDLTLQRATEASMRGAVLLAIESIGKIASDPIDSDQVTLEFNRRNHAIYRRPRMRHKESYERHMG